MKFVVSKVGKGPKWAVYLIEGDKRYAISPPISWAEANSLISRLDAS